jgi:hypothetical protein
MEDAMYASPTIFVGPIVRRQGGFAFDTFSPIEGLRTSFAYRCVEQADYDRKTTLRSAAQGALLIACETIADFQRRCAALLAPTVAV